MTEQERVEACQKDIEAALKRYGCNLTAVMEWERLGDVLQVRARTVQIVALPDWKESDNHFQPAVDSLPATST